MGGVSRCQGRLRLRHVIRNPPGPHSLTSVPEAPFSVFWTEVSRPAPLQTSVPKACFQCFGRKFYALFTCRLPSRGPVFCVLDGSFMPCSPADFRTQAPFSAFWTEVSCPVPLLQTIYNTEKDPSFGRGLCMEVMGG